MIQVNNILENTNPMNTVKNISGCWGPEGGQGMRDE